MHLGRSQNHEDSFLFLRHSWRNDHDQELGMATMIPAGGNYSIKSDFTWKHRLET